MKHKSTIFFIFLLLVIIVLLLDNKPSVNKDVQTTPTNTPTMNTPTPENKTLSQPKMEIDPQKTYLATLKTDQGDITITLDPQNTPITVNNFVYLAKNNFYNNTIFHRTIDGFMIQGGDPTGTGTGGPGYKFADEPFTGEYTRGTIAMANSGPNTNGSQFFIMHQDYDLPKNYVIFGQVTQGIKIVDAIVTAPTQSNSMGENSTPVNPVTITQILIEEK